MLPGRIHLLCTAPRSDLPGTPSGFISDEERDEHWNAAKTLNTVLTVAWGLGFTISG